MPATNTDFWRDKFAGNVSRDADNRRALEEGGWTVIIIRECEIREDPDGALERITVHLAGP